METKAEWIKKWGKWYCMSSMLVGFPTLAFILGTLAKIGLFSATCSFGGWYCEYVGQGSVIKQVAESVANSAELDKSVQQYARIEVPESGNEETDIQRYNKVLEAAKKAAVKK